MRRTAGSGSRSAKNECGSTALPKRDQIHNIAQYLSPVARIIDPAVYRIAHIVNSEEDDEGEPDDPSDGFLHHLVR